MSDDWETPIAAWKEICHRLPKTAVLWDPFYCYGRSESYLQDLGFRVKRSVRCVDKTSNGTCECMNTVQANPSDWDILLTNPPFSQLESVVPWCRSLKKPCIILVPNKVIDRAWFLEALDGIEYELIYPRRRIQFISNGVQQPFATFDTVWLSIGFPRKVKQSKRKRE